MTPIKVKPEVLLVFSLIIFIILTKLVLAVAPTWVGSNVNYTTTEESTYYHNLSANITGFNNDVTFAIDTTQTSIFWTNASGRNAVSQSAILPWISITNSATGNLTINATYDNQTGFFEIPIQAKNTTDNEASTTIFEFQINATNDAPVFTSVNSPFNLTQSLNFLNFLNGTDEESQYPLNFTVSFVSNCTHASWSGRTDGQNCSLFGLGFNLTSFSNLSALMNFTPATNDVGTYWANISVNDFGANYNCPHSFCQNSTYKVNKTTYYSSIAVFNILSTIDINVTNCQNKVFQENQSGTCNVTIRTKGNADSLNISTYASLRNYAAGQNGVVNTSWFYPNSTTTSGNFTKVINITVTPQKTEIGNWTINFTAIDTTNNENGTAQIYVLVNRTLNDVPDLLSISNVQTSINLETTISMSVYDDDLLVPDKNSSFGGFNETTNLTRTILNKSNLSQQLPLSNFSIAILQMPVAGTNQTTAEIRFTANSSDIGNYTINVTAKDNENALDFVLFNLTIINNTAPQWNSSLNTTIFGTEGTNIFLNLSKNVTDAEGDVITFSYTNDTLFPSLNITTAGIVNFTPVDGDVGTHIVNITASDGYLTNSTSFNFTIYNINDNPLIKPLDATNTSPSGSGAITNASTINVTEDNYTTLTLWIEDDDLRIPSVQKGYYNESFTLNVTIMGSNSSLFSFTRDSSWWPQPESAPAAPNRTKYDATFTPRKASAGNYTITINVTDLSNASYLFTFYMNISGIEHSPNLSLLSNQTSAVNRSFYYDINATDTENGNDTSGTNTNFTFSYLFLNDGNNVSFLNSTNFNSTTGIINITFNSTQDGRYHINITVNDSTNRTSTRDFWVFVYGLPTVVSPSSGFVFNLTENTTSMLNFTVNNSVLDNLTYLFYTDFVNCPYSSTSNCNYTSSVLRNSTNYYGNGTSYNLSFASNFSDETYGLLKNLTLVVYPNSSSLTNASSLNTTTIFKLNITHANYPISFSGHIGDQGPVSHDNNITIDLTSYFSDLDYSDRYYNQSPSWSVYINTSSITSSVSSSWVLSLSSSVAVLGLVNLTANDSATTNASSNSFLVRFVDPTSSSSSSSSGGGSVEVPVSMKILLPDPVSAYQQDRIELPITLYNDGQKALNEITLNATIIKNGTVAQGINLSLSQNYFPVLNVGEKKNLTLTANINTSEVGLYEITINADVKNPKYHDWGKLYLTIKKGVDVKEKIVFTEEFIASNPECVELKELVNEAKKLSSEGNTELAIKKADEALDACKNAISQAQKPKIKQLLENKIYRYLAFATVAAFLFGIGYYSYKRIKLKKRQGSFLQQDIKNRNFYNNYSNYNKKGGEGWKAH